MDYTIKDGTRPGALEIYFNGKPGAGIREALKALKMRWNGSKLCWYGFVTEEQINNAINGAGAQDAPEQAKIDALADYKAEYLEILKKGESNWDHWESYYKKEISAAYKIGRYIIGFNKPSIKTSFCFGYGYCGISTQEDEERAGDMAYYARTNEDYFKAENLKKFDETLQAIETVKENRLPMDQQDWTCARCGRDIKDIAFFQNYSGNADRISISFTTYNNEYDGLKNCVDYLTNEELNTYEQAIKIECDKLKKRLNTYLKRYGLSKLHTWSYLSD